jgi:DNA-binding NarL/FixJ family response regulator
MLGYTRSEEQVLRLVLKGRSTRQIAKKLDLSPRTVEVYKQRLARIHKAEPNQPLSEAILKKLAKKTDTWMLFHMYLHKSRKKSEKG